MDNKLLETRLLTRESTIGGSVGSSVSRCSAKFQSLVQSLESNTGSNAVDSFVREILLYKLDTSKCEHVFNACDEEIAAYHELELTIKNDIAQTRQGNVHLEIELDHERQIRTHRETLESDAKQVNALPTRASLKRKIDNTNANIDSVNESLRAVDGRIGQRQQQFTALLQTIADLQSKLLDEEEFVPATAGEIEEEEEEEFREDEGDGRGSTRHSGETNATQVVTQSIEDDEGEGEAGGEGDLHVPVEDGEQGGMDEEQADIANTIETIASEHDVATEEGDNMIVESTPGNVDSSPSVIDEGGQEPCKMEE